MDLLVGIILVAVYPVINCVIFILTWCSFTPDYLVIFLIAIRMICIAGNCLYYNDCLGPLDNLMFQTIFIGVCELLEIVCINSNIGNITKNIIALSSFQLCLSGLICCYGPSIYRTLEPVKREYKLLDITEENLETCSICMDDKRENLVMTECNHVYHKECIEHWIVKYKGSCPNCRNEI